MSASGYFISVSLLFEIFKFGLKEKKKGEKSVNDVRVGISVAM